MFKTKFTGSSNSFDTDFDGYEMLKGEDGFSPEIEVQQIEEGYHVIIIDKNSQHELELKNGKTPEKGVDYFTENDINEMVKSVILELPVYDGEVENI